MWCVSTIIMIPPIAFNTLIENCYHVQLDRLVKEFIVPLEKQIGIEQEEKQVVEKETQEIVGKKRRTCTGTSSSSASKEQMVAVGGTRRSKRVKVAPTRYDPVVEEKPCPLSPLASSCVVTMHTTLTAAVRHQQVPHEEKVLSSDEEESESKSSLLEFVDTVQQFQDETVSSDEEVENDSTSSVHLHAIQHTSGNKRKRRAPIQSFDDRFTDLMSFKAKYGHCDVSKRGEDASLGQWCCTLRGLYKKMRNSQKPTKFKLSDGQIRRLNDAGFKWSLRKANSGFDERFNDLMAFKANYGHCNVPTRGEDAYLAQWCSHVRVKYKKMRNNQKPNAKLLDGQIQRLNDAGFKWSLVPKVGWVFNKRFNDLMAFKANYGHCNVSQNGETVSLGQWCSHVRGSYKKMQNNQKPKTKILDEQIQRLHDAGFKWSLV
jgi:hypothetical protein